MVTARNIEHPQNGGVERLTKHLRLTVYNYLPVKDTLLGPALLSSTERKNLRESEIAREGKNLNISWEGSYL